MQTELCAICGGGLEAEIITHQQSDGQELLEFEQVPAMVCGQCGERWLDAHVMEVIDHVIRNKPEPKRFHQVPVFSLADFPGSTSR